MTAVNSQGMIINAVNFYLHFPHDLNQIFNIRYIGYVF